ncbi:MAG TPA: PEP-CTERM sorting domain-containing protein, partial [Candidatus Eisenbacteria bacterium]|nr:PEP-CTERM sorting domain-containing protein [Candidatus Eisenbacteria bacterium]
LGKQLQDPPSLDPRDPRSGCFHVAALEVLHMQLYLKFLKGIALAALASVFLYGAALAVPSPSYPSYQPGSDAALTSATPAATHSAADARILFRTSDRLLARGTFQRGGGSLAGNVATISTGTSRSKSRYLLSGMVLAALTPLAIHHFGEPGDKSVAVQTQTPGSSSLANLGDAISSGNGHGRGGDKGNGGGDKGGGGGDGEDCNNDNGGDHGGDNGDDDGGEVCDTGDHGDNGGSGDNGGDCDNGGDHDSGGGGGDHGGGGTSLPEPGTVPLVGAGLMMALAFRSRRAR